MIQTMTRSKIYQSRHRRGLALIICLMVIAVTSALAVGIVHTQTTRLSLAANLKDHSQAAALAEAGLEHAIALLLEDANWRGDVGWVQLPANSPNEYRFRVETSGAEIHIQSTGRTPKSQVVREVTYAF